MKFINQFDFYFPFFCIMVEIKSILKVFLTKSKFNNIPVLSENVNEASFSHVIIKDSFDNNV